MLKTAHCALPCPACHPNCMPALLHASACHFRAPHSAALCRGVKLAAESCAVGQANVLADPPALVSCKLAMQ